MGQKTIGGVKKMLYSEFLKGTRAPETPDTYDQFQIIPDTGDHTDLRRQKEVKASFSAL